MSIHKKAENDTHIHDHSEDFHKVLQDIMRGAAIGANNHNLCMKCLYAHLAITALVNLYAQLEITDMVSAAKVASEIGSQSIRIISSGDFDVEEVQAH